MNNSRYASTNICSFSVERIYMILSYIFMFILMFLTHELFLRKRFPTIQSSKRRGVPFTPSYRSSKPTAPASSGLIFAIELIFVWDRSYDPVFVVSFWANEIYPIQIAVKIIIAFFIVSSIFVQNYNFTLAFR